MVAGTVLSCHMPSFTVLPSSAGKLNCASETLPGVGACCRVHAVMRGPSALGLKFTLFLSFVSVRPL